jgi:hypothetical protein
VNAGHVRICPSFVIVCERSGSYRERTDACAKRSVAPRLAGCSGLPSTFVGRPVWLSTRMPVAYPRSVEAVAKKSGRPGMTSSGCLTYGTRPSRGCFTQAVRPASASEAPESSRKRRRLTPASHSEA